MPINIDSICSYAYVYTIYEPIVSGCRHRASAWCFGGIVCHDLRRSKEIKQIFKKTSDPMAKICWCSCLCCCCCCWSVKNTSHDAIRLCCCIWFCAKIHRRTPKKGIRKPECSPISLQFMQLMKSSCQCSATKRPCKLRVHINLKEWSVNLLKS